MIPETGKAPNKYTIAMGELIRKAREEAGLSQEELGEKIYRKRLAVSEMENGKVEFSAWVLPNLAHALKKPISYFFPGNLSQDIPQENLSPLEHELLLYFREIWDDTLQRLAVKQIKIISEYDPEEMLLNSINELANRFEIEENVIDLIERRKNRKKT